MKQILMLLTIFYSLNYSAQYQNLKIKERFDQVYNYAKNYWDYNPYLMHYGTDTEKNDNQSYLGSSFAPALDGLLIMYETTKEECYLEEFMMQAIKIYHSRADKITPQYSTSSYWCNGGRVYMNGRILWPLAHFVYLVKSDPLLQSKAIVPSRHEGKTTLGAFADFINQNNIEVMDTLMSKFWISGNGNECMWKPDHIYDNYNPSNPPRIMELNMQASFGCAFIYMYLANLNRTDYGTKATTMAKKYLEGKLKNPDGTETSTNVLAQYGAYNAYIWYHRGWQKPAQYWSEDIGHGALDISFPILYNRYYNAFTSITAGQYFESYQMVRFRNTFTKLISKDFSITGNFTKTIGGNYTGYYDPKVGDQDGFNLNAKSWIELSEFDNVAGAQSGNGVYTNVMNYYNTSEQYRIVGLNGYLTEGIDIRGLANLVKYQWKNNPVNYKATPFYCKPMNVLRVMQSYDSQIAEEQNEINIAPNPITSTLHLNNLEEGQNYEINIIDVIGRQILKTSLNKTNSEMNFSNIPSGIYYINITNGPENKTLKFIKE